MKVAITGASSRLGAELVSRLESESGISQILGIDRCEPAHRSKKFTFIRRDIRDERIRKDLQGYDAIVHLAFIIQPPLPPLKEVYSVNIDGSKNVFDCAIRANIKKIVFASSVAAYGSFPDNPTPLTEEHPIRLMTPEFYYNAGKFHVEKCLDALETVHSGLIVTRIRPCTILGKVSSHLMSRRVFINPCPDVPVQFVWIDDSVNAFCLALLKDTPGAFNIAGDIPLTWREIASLADRMAVTVPYHVAHSFAKVSYSLGLQKRLIPGWIRMARYPAIMDCSKAKNVLGWAPQYDTRGAVSQFFEYDNQRVG